MTLLGTRVVRGPDWEWQNQDGGEGHVGTVVQIGKDKKSPTTAQLVWVQWDCGIKANYRAGFDGKHDLRVFDNAIGGTKHLHVMCDGCQKDPIAGMRWHCLTCPNYDLCTTCYMTDKHNLEHRFERIDKSRGKRVNVGSRQGSDKQEARGMFKGAKVVRGADWEWKNQDGGARLEGEVTDVASWDNDESAKNAVRVNWKEGQRSNIYRLGKDGKVDLKCTMAVSGGSYYKDHLPVLKVELKKSQSGLTTGDKVIIQVSEEKLQELCDGHGGWNADMKMFIRKVGVIQDFTSNGDVLVEYPEKVWRFNPAALSRIQEFKRGDEVIIKSEKNLVKDLQEGHGGWNEAMISILGRTGKVLEVDGTGDLVVLVEGDKWMLNPAAVTCVTDPEPGERSPSEDGSSEDPLGLFRLFRDFLGMHHAFEQMAGQTALNLVSACKSNQLSRVKEILDDNPEMIDEVQGAHSGLHIACHEGHCDVIRELIDRGASREILDSQGYTAFHHATYGDKTGEALKLLLEKGFDPNVQNSDNKSTPLHLAVKNDNDMAVRILAQSPECDVNLQDEAGDTPLYDAIASEKHNMVDMMLNNPRLSLTVTNKRGFNYLQFAVLKGNTRAVEKLLAKAGDILNVAKSDGFTTLHIAAINDHREIAKLLLLQPGCCVDAPTVENQTALHLAASEGYSVMCEILLDYGACVNAKDNDNDTPLHITLAKETIFKGSIGQLSALHLLLRGRNSVSYAAVSRCLLSYGADVLQANKNGETPLDRCDGTEVEQLIREIANSAGNAQVKKVPSFGGTKVTNPEQNVSQVSSHSSSASTGMEAQGQAPSERDEQNVVQDEEGSDTGHQSPNSAMLQDDEDDEVNVQETEEEENLEESPERKLLDNTLEHIQENIVLEVTNQVPQESFTAEFSNSSSDVAVQVKEMNNGELMNDSGADQEFGEGEQEPNQTNRQRESQTIVENTENEIQKEIEGKEERPKCYICEENEAEVAFKHCGHTVVCTGPRMPSPPSPIPARRTDLKEKRLEVEEDFILCKLRDQEEVQDKTFDDVTGSGRASYESAGPRMPVKISPPFPIKGKEVKSKIPQKRVTYTHVPQDQEEVQGETYEDVIGSENQGPSSKNESFHLVTENLERIITQDGGEVSGKHVLLKIPPGAVSHPVYVRVTKKDPSKYYCLILQKNLENDVRVCAPILKLQPSGYRFIKPVTLSATYGINDCRCADFLILHGTKERDGEISWQDVTPNASIEKTFKSVRVTIEIKGFSIIAALWRLSVIRIKDIVTRLNLLAFSFTMAVLVSAQKNEIVLLFLSQDVYNETFYRNHKSSALVQLKAQGFTEVHVRSIGEQDERRIYNSESLQVSICLGEDYKFIDSESYNFHFNVESYVWWNTGHVIKLSLGKTRDVRILCGKVSIEGQYGHRSQRHFCELDLNGYVMELMAAKGEICNFLPIAHKLMMPKSLIDQVLKSWKNEDQQLELMLQYWLNENEVLDDHQALRKDLEGLQHVCRVTQRGQMHVGHLRELATTISGLQHENSDLAKNIECKIQTLCKSLFRDCCIELEHLSDKIERAASSTNHVDYLEIHRVLPKDAALIYKRICSSTTEVPNSISENFLSIVPQLIQTMKEVYVRKETSQVQNGLRGLPDKVLEQFVSDVRDAVRKNKVRPLVGQMCKVLEDLCLENCGKRSTAEIEKWAKGLALLSMLEFLKPFFQHCPQDIRLHTRLELFSGNLRDIMLELMDVADKAFVRDLSDVVLSLVAFAKFEPSKLVRFELFDITGALLDCNAIENLKYDRYHDSFSQRFYIRNKSDGELQVHALACVLIDDRICKIGAFQSVVLLCPSGKPAFDKCMTRFSGVTVARQKDKDSENFRMVLCSTKKEELSEALDELEGELREDLVNFKKSVITPCNLTMRSVTGRKGAVLSLRLVYKWGSEAVSVNSSDFSRSADSTADGAWIPEVQVKGLTGPDEQAEEAGSALVQASGVGNSFPLDAFDTQRMRKHTVINCEKIEYHIHKTDNYMKGHVCVVGDQTTLNDQSLNQRALQEGPASDPMRHITDGRR